MRKRPQAAKLNYIDADISIIYIKTDDFFENIKDYVEKNPRVSNFEVVVPLFIKK